MWHSAWLVSSNGVVLLTRRRLLPPPPRCCLLLPLLPPPPQRMMMIKLILGQSFTLLQIAGNVFLATLRPEADHPFHLRLTRRDLHACLSQRPPPVPLRRSYLSQPGRRRNSPYSSSSAFPSHTYSSIPCLNLRKSFAVQTLTAIFG